MAASPATQMPSLGRTAEQQKGGPSEFTFPPKVPRTFSKLIKALTAFYRAAIRDCRHMGSLTSSQQCGTASMWTWGVATFATGRAPLLQIQGPCFFTVFVWTSPVAQLGLLCSAPGSMIWFRQFFAVVSVVCVWMTGPVMTQQLF